MKKVFLLSSILITSLIADNNLGEKISVASAEEKIIHNPSHTPSNHSRQIDNQQSYANPQSQPLDTRVSPRNIKNAFQQDHHRYNKRYSHFDYDRHGYYNNDGYYYGYYDTTGYFFNNIFFAYNRNYSYNDRHYRRGFFRHGHRHRRHYVHHTFNDWNRIHSYRSPNVIVRGHYYDRAYLPRTHYRPNYRHSYNNRRSHYNNRHNYNNHNYSRQNQNIQRSPSRMNVNRLNGQTSSRANTSSRQQVNQNNYRNNNQRQYSNQNNYRDNAQRRNENRRSSTRMTTRNSSHGQKSNRHMRMSK